MPSAESGDEVQFGLSLSSPETRTIYGYGEKTEKSYPIYWVNGDKVQIYSPQCQSGRNNAEYQVSVDGAKQKYASSLTPTGATGVQWGTEASDFYSVYPSGDYTISEDGKSITDLKINFSDDFEVVDGAVVPKQADCLMFASTKQVAVGSTVNLLYSPIATSVTFTINGPTSGDPVTIQSVKLIAPTGTYIAGNFNVQLCEDESANKGKYIFSDWAKDDNGRTNSSETISAQIYDKSTGAFHEIGEGESLPISFFLVPRTDLAITKDWKIQVVTTNKTFTKSLAFGTEAKTNLAPGMVHELPGLPKLDEGTAEWSVTDWMKNIPRNVYLSEVSIPGSWNSLNPDFQTQSTNATATVKDQYDLGVRAFHIDTRWQAEGVWIVASPNGVLGVAVGGTTLGGSTDKYMPASKANSFETVLSAITSNVKNDEYMVVICSFAQNSAEYDGANGWIKAISSICAANDKVVMASMLNQDTLVGDVLGKVIVIINTESEIKNTTVPADELSADSKCLFTYMPSELTADNFKLTTDNFNESSVSLWRTTAEATIHTGIDMYNTQAQITSDQEDAINGFSTSKRGYAPSIKERKAILEKILDWSKMNYGTENYSHDKWLYLGLGGYQVNESDSDLKPTSGSYANIASIFNNWINDKVTEMGTTPSGQTEAVPYYPVGIVLMNNVNTYKDSAVKNILLLNNKYRLQFDPNKPTDYKPATKSAAASYSSGMNDQGASAFGWE